MPVHYYRLNAGTHVQNDPVLPGETTPREGKYKTGDKVPSETNLAERFPEKFSPATPPKANPYAGGAGRATAPTPVPPSATGPSDSGSFEELRAGGEPADEPQGDTSPPAGPDDADLEVMTVAQLRDYAAREEIDVHGAKTKAELLERIKTAEGDLTD